MDGLFIEVDEAELPEGKDRARLVLTCDTRSQRIPNPLCLRLSRAEAKRLGERLHAFAEGKVNSDG